MDELNKANLSAAAGKQGRAELYHTRMNSKLHQITLNHKIFLNTNFRSPHKSKGKTLSQKRYMKKGQQGGDNIFYSVHIALLNIFPKPGLMRVYSPCSYTIQNQANKIYVIQM